MPRRAATSSSTPARCGASSLGRTYRPIMLLLGAAAFLAGPRDAAARGPHAGGPAALAVFVVCLVYWVTNVLPLMVTSLLAIVLLPLDGRAAGARNLRALRQRGGVLHPRRLHPRRRAS